MEMGKKLRELRTSKHLSVYRISQDTGLSPNHIRALERGERNPSLETLSRLCVPLGISILELLCEDEEVSYLSERERTLVEYFRTLPDAKADVLLTVARALNE